MTTAEQAIITSALVHRGIKTGDAVRVGSEKWLVAFCENGRVWCCGWPLADVAARGVDLARIATPGRALALLCEMAGLRDARGEYARRKLAEIRGASRATGPHAAR